MCKSHQTTHPTFLILWHILNQDVCLLTRCSTTLTLFVWLQDDATFQAARSRLRVEDQARTLLLKNVADCFVCVCWITYRSCYCNPTCDCPEAKRYACTFPKTIFRQFVCIDIHIILLTKNNDNKKEMWYYRQIKAKKKKNHTGKKFSIMETILLKYEILFISLQFICNDEIKFFKFPGITKYFTILDYLVSTIFMMSSTHKDAEQQATGASAELLNWRRAANKKLIANWQNYGTYSRTPLPWLPWLHTVNTYSGIKIGQYCL